MSEIRCWCGNLEMATFSPDYGVCKACGTLVCLQHHDPGFFQVLDDGGSFYGRDYWFDHQIKALNNPPIMERARNDLSERALHWLTFTLKYCRPPASCLELGSGHGGFVAMLKQSGYDARGLELSPWVVEYSKRIFGVPVLLGPIEDQDIQPASLDLIVMMDVLEHLDDPVSTLQYCVRLLKPDGKFIIQTPEFIPGKSFEQLKQDHDPFLKLLLPGEHVQLFTKESIIEFFRRLDYHFWAFEKAYFPYDMFLVASAKPIQVTTANQVEEFLLSSPGGRMMMALLDLNDKKATLDARIAESEADRKKRLEIINGLQKQLEESESDRAARLAAIKELEVNIREIEVDRTARLDAIHTLEKQLHESEADRRARLENIQELESLLRESETDRAARLELINTLESKLQEVEAERNLLSENLHLFDPDLERAHEELLAQQETIQLLDHRLIGLENDLDTMRTKDMLQTSNIHRQAFYIALYEQELSRFPLNILRRIQNKLIREKDLFLNRQHLKRFKRKSGRLVRIVVDLTPVLPGGENGGAKLLATALVWQLSQVVAPDCVFLLLTSDDSHEELSWLDAENVQRICVNTRLDRSERQVQLGINDPVGNKEQDIDAGNKITPSSNESTLPEDLSNIFLRLIHWIGVVLESVLPRSLYSQIYRYYRSDLKPPKTKKVVLDLKGDLLFCPFTAPFYYSAGIPTVIVVHDLQFYAYPQFFDNKDFQHADYYFRKSCQVADRLVCVSEFTRKSVLEVGEISADRVTTIHTSFYNRLENVGEDIIEPILDEYQIATRQFILYPANFWPHKNHEMLLTAFNIFIKRNPRSRLKLVLTGAPCDRMEFLKQASQGMGIDGRVVFPGFVDQQTLSAFFQNCLVVIFPSIYEGFGVPVLEAMSFGVPVLSSMQTSLPEVGRDAVHYFDPRKPDEIVAALERIEVDENYRNHLIKKGKERVGIIDTPVQWAEQYYQVFKDVMAADRILSNEISGIHLDHWVGDRFEISIREGLPVRFLEFNFEVPAWFPYNQLAGKVISNGRKWKSLRAIRGQRNIIRLPLTGLSYQFEVVFSQTTQPRNYNVNEDIRFLSCRLLWCRLITQDGVVSIYEAGIG